MDRQVGETKTLSLFVPKLNSRNASVMHVCTRIAPQFLLEVQG